MELKDIINYMIENNVRSSQPTDYCTGTVTSTSPLEISINSAMAPIKSGLLILTANVIEKKIPILKHIHIISDGSTCMSALDDIVCYENGEALPVENGYIILNRALEVGDKVIMVKVQHGQKFIVLSRAF